MITVFVSFCLRAIIWITLLIMLVFVGHRKSRMWKRGIYAGMFLNGTSGFGYLAPGFIPYADMVGLVGNAVMIVSVALSYIRKGQLKDRTQMLTAFREIALFVLFYFGVSWLGFYYHGKYEKSEAEKKRLEAQKSQEVNEVKASVSAVKEGIDSVSAYRSEQIACLIEETKALRLENKELKAFLIKVINNQEFTLFNQRKIIKYLETFRLLRPPVSPIIRSVPNLFQTPTVKPFTAPAHDPFRRKKSAQVDADMYAVPDSLRYARSYKRVRDKPD